MGREFKTGAEDEDMVDLEAEDAFAGALCRDTGDNLDAPADL